MNVLTATANQWTDTGIAVIPIAYRDKRPSLPSWREFQERLPTAAEIARWFADRFHNLAIVTGWRGLVVLDFDQRPMYELCAIGAAKPRPKRDSRTRSKPAAASTSICFVDEPVQSGKAGSIDIKAAGGYVLAPPSIHPSGRPYRLLSDAPILRVDRLAAVLPPGLLALAQPVNPPRPPRVLLSDDPWQAAMNPVLPAGDGAIAAIKAQHDLFELFPDAHRRGRRFVARCPLHDDRDPSVSLSDSGDYAKCWAGCLQGDFVDWYAALHGLTLVEAVRELA